MNKILMTRLINCEINLSDIISSVKHTDNDIMYVYTSHLEGLGTNNSDIDVYLISEKQHPSLKMPEQFFLEQVYIGNTILDVEYWPMSEVSKILDKLNDFSYDIKISDLKILHRFKVSECFLNNSSAKKIQEKITSGALDKRIYDYYRIQSTSFLEDATYLYEAKNYSSCSSCAYKSLDAAIGYINAKNGTTNLKGKWIPTIFLKSSKNSEKLKKEFLYYQIFTPKLEEENIASFLEEKIEFIQSLLSSSVFSQ